MDDNYAGGYDEQELVAVIPSQQNWKGIGISLVVILSVIGVVAASVYMMTPPNTGPRIKGLRMELGNLTSGMFQTNHYNCTWYSDKDLAFIDPTGDLVLLDTQTRDTKTIVSANIFKTLNSFSFSLSPDRVWIVVGHEVVSSLYGSTALYSIQNLQTELNSPVMKVGVESLDTWDAQERLQHVSWAGSKTGGGVVIVKNNNLFYQPDPMENKNVDRITSSGINGIIFNGISDWTYKERILKTDSALWVSPDSSKVLYLSINCSGLNEVRYPRLLGSHDSGLDDIFIKYPMAGRNISRVKVFMYDFKSKQNKQIKPPDFLNNRHYYVENVAWVNSESWTITWLTRDQDFRIVSYCQQSGSCSQELFESASNYGYNSLSINHHKPVLNSERTKMAYIALKLEGELGLFPHIHIKALNEDGIKAPKIVTYGAWRVKQLLSWHQQDIYFTGTAGDQDSTQHLFRYQLDHERVGEAALNNSLAEHTINGVTCITCATPCQNTKPVLSPDNSLFVQQCLGPGIPYTQVCSTETGECFLHLENNTELQETISQFSLPQTKLIMVEVSPGRLITVELKLPAGFRESEEFAFPLLVHIDALFPRIHFDWKINWVDYLSSQKDYIVAKIEIANSERTNETILGATAQTDILQVMRYLSEELKYVDKTKIALVGEDEGGYTAGMVYSADIDAGYENTLTKCIIFISPTVNWKLTDAFRSENLLGPRSKQSNWNRYELSSLTANSLGFPGQSLYLTNRPGDLVNLHQLFQLSRKLVLEGTVFKQQVYIDDGQDVNSWLHFYKSMEAHLETCLGPVEDYYRDDYFLASMDIL